MGIEEAKLTKEEIAEARNVTNPHYMDLYVPWKPLEEDRERAIADAATRKAYAQGRKDTLAELAAQCGPDPCVECKTQWVCGGLSYKRKHICDKWVSYQGRQVGMAKGLQEKGI